MFLLSYRYRDNDKGEGWDISDISFTKNNLFVGVSGSGKSRMLNSLMNIGIFISQNIFRDGMWEIKFKINDSTYNWLLHSTVKNGEQIILSETLSLCAKDADDQIIFNRNDNSFLFNNTPLPKLPKNSTGIHLLKEEDAVKPVYDGFGKILRRNFFGADLIEACTISNVLPELLNDKDAYKSSAQKILISSINVRLYLLQKHERDLFDTLVEEYKAIFHSIENIDFIDGSALVGNSGFFPVLTLKEKGINHPIMLHELSSGMQKVLLIITDIITLPNSSIYIIDEYENSLGINAINFLPEFIISYGKDSQFITTSHHPYLINNIPISDWKIFSRKGSTVSVKSGDVLKEIYSKSKQDSFIQLMNDPAYIGS